jgi:hypothetical protein
MVDQPKNIRPPGVGPVWNGSILVQVAPDRYRVEFGQLRRVIPDNTFETIAMLAPRLAGGGMA